MYNILNSNNNPYFNMALEEYILKYKDLDDDCIIFWQNSPTVVVGRNQNTIEEINSDYIEQNKINVVRRLTGGGAVYHDLGNLNFTFIVSKNNDKDMNDFESFTKPLIQALKELGINAHFTGRNDVLIEDKKFSGNAQYKYKDKILHHGTILFNSDLNVVSKALNVKMQKIESKGIKSVRSRVTNIYPNLKQKLNVVEFKEFLIGEFKKNFDIVNYYLSEEDLNKIEKLADEKYRTWNWVFGESPKFNLKKESKFSGGLIDLRLQIEDGYIKNLKIYGDFFGDLEVSVLEKELVGLKFLKSEVNNKLYDLEFEKIIKGISEDEFVRCIFS